MILDEFRLHHREGDFPFSFGFRKVADAFRLIDDTGKPVIIPWGKEGKNLCERLRRGSPLPPRDVLRGLQRYTVQIPGRTWDQESRNLELVHDRYPVLISPELHYSERKGLSFDIPQTVFIEG